MRRQNGITLIELIIVMAIMFLTLIIGVPNLSRFVKNSELINTSNKVASLMSFARSEATKRKLPVSLCRSADNATCNASGTNLIVLNSADELLRTTPLSDDVKFFYQNLTSSTITFDSFGIPNDVGEIVLCDDRGAAYAKGIALNMGGQVRALVPAEIAAISCS